MALDCSPDLFAHRFCVLVLFFSVLVIPKCRRVSWSALWSTFRRTIKSCDLIWFWSTQTVASWLQSSQWANDVSECSVGAFVEIFCQRSPDSVDYWQKICCHGLNSKSHRAQCASVSVHQPSTWLCVVTFMLSQRQAHGNHFFQRGSRLKIQILSCNMIRWYSPRPLKSCWLLMQHKGKAPRRKW